VIAQTPAHESILDMLFGAPLPDGGDRESALLRVIRYLVSMYSVQHRDCDRQHISGAERTEREQNRESGLGPNLHCASVGQSSDRRTWLFKGLLIRSATCLSQTEEMNDQFEQGESLCVD
jgi:hypothetical protein